MSRGLSPPSCRTCSAHHKKGHALARPAKRQNVFSFRLSEPVAGGTSAHPNRLSALRAKLRAHSAPPDAPRWAEPAAVPVAAELHALLSSFSEGPTVLQATASSLLP